MIRAKTSNLRSAIVEINLITDDHYSCTPEDHATIKRSYREFRSETYAIYRRGLDSNTFHSLSTIDDGTERMEFRNCMRCHSTLIWSSPSQRSK